MTNAPTVTDSNKPWAKSPGDEPLPGYVLMEPLGRGGFGEVWKCEAPGGLHKAIKFVAPDPDGGPRAGDCLRQEFDAFQQIKKIRHPFLLTCERVELIKGELVTVMELADRHLYDRYVECVGQNMIGIPRDELLNYFADAAEALDLICEDYQLQHLDIKPANLFLVGRHVKVGDYGLVSKLDPTGSAQEASRENRGLTPRYAAPEVLRGRVDARSDQYSLALVYFELLTGEFPYTARTPQQMLLQHVTAAPNLTALPEGDRPAIAKALSKVAADRFPSCLAFVQGLLAAPTEDGSNHARRARVDRIVSQGHRVEPSPTTKGRTPITDPSPTSPGRSTSDPSPTARGRVVSAPHVTLRSGAVPSLTLPGGALPALTTQGRAAQSQRNSQQVEEEADELLDLVLAASAPPRANIVLKPIRGVVPVGRLTGHEEDPGPLNGPELVAAILAHAAAGGHLSHVPGDMGRLADGTWTDAFPATQVAATASFKLAVLREEWGCEQLQTMPGVIVLRRNAAAAGGLWGKLSGTKVGGLEIEVRLPPPGKPIGEVRVLGRLFGTPDRNFAVQAESALPQMVREVRRVLQNVDDRRRAARVAVNMPVTVYPIHEDGLVQPGFAGTCRDVSTGGVCFAIDRPAPTRYAYLTFDAVGGYDEYAILVALIRATPAGQLTVAGGRFRTDI